jgi:hypothetical protein
MKNLTTRIKKTALVFGILEYVMITTDTRVMVTAVWLNSNDLAKEDFNRYT